MKQGILYVVFGEVFEKFALQTLRISRQNTSYPFHILTNIKNLNPVWNNIKDISFSYFDLKDTDNRFVKTRAIDYTPFDETLLLDADTIINNEVSFAFLDYADMALNRLFYWDKGVKIPKIYKETFIRFDVHLPISIYSGAFIMFRNMKRVLNVFDKYHNYWIETGKGREMPSLNCAISKTDINVAVTPLHYFNPYGLRNDVTIQHYCDNFCKHYGIDPIGHVNKFDNDPQAFSFFDYE